jgi:SNF2 family DNA or RNA helicase
VCPTSLVYNWKEECHKFNPTMKVLVVDSTPAQRRKLLKSIGEYDIVVTSYNLLQKDVALYQEILFGYLILDEAQHIKNRGTRNAKSVKILRAAHRLILTGTPIENSLDELWSLFDFLMPGLLGSYDRFVEKFIRPSKIQGEERQQSLEALKRKLSPFILRRMKEDVLEDLPPVSEIVYHCNLTDTQLELYRSYAASAKEELSKLVQKEGFDKIQIHVLATLTRLKQICCHPAIFAKESPESGDCAKYDMLMELLSSLIEGGHKSVIFSQYTKMLGILREDLQRKGIPFAYLDGSSKNRLEIVKNFNNDPTVPIFLVSLKAGGAGLNLVGADTVIHYDMWWNPAVENQATDRVHRLGQKKSVSSYKLVTLNTIEEKILNLQKRKKGLVKKVISSDDEAISKLTWEEVLELLQT